MRHYILGGTDTAGQSITPYILSERARTHFVIYCRRCHAGLCAKLEIGSVDINGKLHNVILVNPCGCDAETAVSELPDKYRSAVGPDER